MLLISLFSQTRAYRLLKAWVALWMQVEILWSKISEELTQHGNLSTTFGLMFSRKIYSYVKIYLRWHYRIHLHTFFRNFLGIRKLNTTLVTETIYTKQDDRYLFWTSFFFLKSLQSLSEAPDMWFQQDLSEMESEHHSGLNSRIMDDD